jgi:hypothetical protein
VTFQTEVEIAKFGAGRREQRAGYTVISYDPIERYCDQVILLADEHAIQLAVGSQEGWTGTADMCEIIDAAREAVLARLAAQGIGVRTPLTGTSPLAGISSCSLLTADDLSLVIPNPAPARPRFADWGCDWASYSGDNSVELIYYRSARWTPTPAHPPTSPGVPASCTRGPDPAGSRSCSAPTPSRGAIESRPSG